MQQRQVYFHLCNRVTCYQQVLLPDGAEPLYDHFGNAGAALRWRTALFRSNVSDFFLKIKVQKIIFKVKLYIQTMYLEHLNFSLLFCLVQVAYSQQEHTQCLADKTIQRSIFGQVQQPGSQVPGHLVVISVLFIKAARKVTQNKRKSGVLGNRSCQKER